MLQIEIPRAELYNESNNEFITLPPVKLQLEHSLVSLSKWESKWHKPFLSDEKKTVEETVDYIRCMTITQNVPPDVYLRINSSIVDQVNAYIDDPMTATTFNDVKKEGQAKKKTIVTSELIYYWMIALNIPPDFQKWHLNRLLTLIRVCEIKNTPSKKMSPRELMSRNRALNAARRQKFNTRG